MLPPLVNHHISAHASRDGRVVLFAAMASRSVSDLSPSTQDYLKVIWGLQEWSEDRSAGSPPHRFRRWRGMRIITNGVFPGKGGIQDYLCANQHGA